MLPCDTRGLPLHDSFIAVSFEAMQDAFQNAKLANNAFVFMAQSLCDGVPAFCLACVGTDNKFSADLILNRWTHIVSECKKRGITVASFGADGDSRELKAMQVSTSLLSAQSSSASLSPSNGLKRLDIPPQWLSWLVCCEEAYYHSVCPGYSTCCCQTEVKADQTVNSLTSWKVRCRCAPSPPNPAYIRQRPTWAERKGP